MKRLITANAVSSLGDGMQVAAFPLICASLTGDPRTIAALAAAGSVPALIGAVPVGGLIEKVSRARLMVILDLGRALILGTLVALIAVHLLALWQLFVLALLMGTGQMLSEISSSALVPEIAPAGQLPRVNGLLSTTTELGGGLAGPAVGGFLYAGAAGLPFGVNAVSFLAAGIILSSLARHEMQARAQPSGAWPRSRLGLGLRAGAGWVARDRQVRSLALMVAAWSLFGWMPEAVLVLYARQDLHGSSVTFGGLLAATSVGAVLGGLLAGRLIARMGIARTLAPALLTYAVLMAPPAFLASAYLVAVVFFLQGIPVLIFTVAAATVRQTLVPAGLMARVSSVFYLTGAGMAPLGLIAGGLIGSYLGLRMTFLAGAAGLSVAVIRLSRPLRDIDLRMPGPAGAAHMAD